MTNREEAAPTVDRLRIDIDRGHTGDKVAVEDPAAAPLGTDAEAAGHPPTPFERKVEAAARTVATEAPHKPGSSVYLLCGAALAVAILLVVAVATMA